VEDPHQPFEVTLARGGEESLDDLALGVQVGVGNPVLSAHSPAGAARQLASGLRRAVDDRGDLVEGHAEHVVQHEREPLRRGQGLEHHEQCEPHRVRQERLVLGVRAVGAVHDRLRHAHAERLLAPRAA
jgi:hypothetical protein